MTRLSKPVLIAVGIVAGMLGALLARQLFHSPKPLTLANATLLTPARPLPEFSLIDGEQHTFDRNQLRTRWSLLFFGFTNCGDVCPLTLTTLTASIKTFHDMAPDLPMPKVIFISVDSKRDTPEVVRRYVTNFNSDFIGVTGEQSAIDAFTKSLGVPSAIRQLDNGAYAVDHSAAILVVNPNAELQAIFSPPQTAAGIAEDMRVLIGASR